MPLQDFFNNFITSVAFLLLEGIYTIRKPKTKKSDTLVVKFQNLY